MSQEGYISNGDMLKLKPLLKELNDKWFAITGKRLYARFEWHEDIGPNHPNEPMSGEILIEKADIRMQHTIIEY